MPAMDDLQQQSQRRARMLVLVPVPVLVLVPVPVLVWMAAVLVAFRRLHHQVLVAGMEKR
jgi:hypothetical protein